MEPTISVDPVSGWVTVGDPKYSTSHVGKIHWPYEYDGRRVSRKSWLTIIDGKKVGTYPSFVEAASAAVEAAKLTHPVEPSHAMPVRTGDLGRELDG